MVQHRGGRIKAFDVLLEFSIGVLVQHGSALPETVEMFASALSHMEHHRVVGIDDQIGLDSSGLRFIL